MLDNLLLEVQRSLDYFEGQLRQAPVKEILFQIASNELRTTGAGHVHVGDDSLNIVSADDVETSRGARCSDNVKASVSKAKRHGVTDKDVVVD